MPPYKPRSKRVRKVAKRAYKAKASKAIIPRTMISLGQGFPKKIQMTLKYMENGQVTCTSGVINKYQYATNNCRDPNFTGTGHQPMYLDQALSLYNLYTVIGSKIDIKVMPVTTTQAATCVGILLNDDSTFTPTDISAANEATQSTYKYLPVGCNEPVSLTYKWSAKKMFGGSILGNPELTGTSAANPVKQSFYSIYISTLDGSSSATVYLELTMTFIVIFRELKDLISS